MLTGMIKEQIRQVKWDVRHDLPNITWLWDSDRLFPLSFKPNHNIELDFRKYNMSNPRKWESFPIIYTGVLPIYCIEGALRSLRN